MVLQDVDARHKAGHDGSGTSPWFPSPPPIRSRAL